ncbi:hypothetical protein DPMN_075288 [Dreissena polymorpha]|uniref:Uncharacterized protein n=1 Tax=Dreissena polymorpha TaxID=45954 RepID=A0A9D3YK38_DREPO|nr:hypothetical protein DPMN_075288 [Dreissena polymorpha]
MSISARTSHVNICPYQPCQYLPVPAMSNALRDSARTSHVNICPYQPCQMHC